MNKEIKALWVKALRSNAYKESAERDHPPLRSYNDEYNLFGVLCDIIDNTKWARDEHPKPYCYKDPKGVYYRFYFSSNLQAIAEIYEKEYFILKDMTEQGLRFADIADFIEDSL